MYKRSSVHVVLHTCSASSSLKRITATVYSRFSLSLPAGSNTPELQHMNTEQEPVTAHFRKHLEKFIAIDASEFTAILSFFEVKHYRKKEDLLTEGQVCKWHFFVLEGCLRKFFVNEKGVEQTTEFAIENWWITDNMAYEHRQATEFTIQAVEASAVLVIDSAAQEQLLLEHPKMERYFRFIYQRAYGAWQMRIKWLYSMSGEAFYHHFYDSHPEFVQRVPQYLLASFLGITPEYLSEIRNKKRS